MIVTIGAVLLAAAVVLYIIQPLVVGMFAPLEKTDDEATDAEATRRVKLLALRDVEYDFQTGKLDREDYISLKKELSTEALAALEATERETQGLGDDALEAEIAQVRAGIRSGDACVTCGFRNPAGSRFCSACGSELGAELEEAESTGGPSPE